MAKKRTGILSLVMAVALMLSLCLGAGGTAFAAEAPEPGCSHEAGRHDDTCGFVAPTEEAPCANAETDPACTHEGDCGYTAADPGAPCAHAEHSEECGGLVSQAAEEDPVTTTTADTDVDTDTTADTAADITTGAITGFELAEVSVAPGTAEAELGLPGQVAATVQPDGEGAQPITVMVGVGSWVTPQGMAAYDPASEEPTVYMFEADPDGLALPDGITLPEAAGLPCARVTVGEPGEVAPLAAAAQQIGSSATSWDLADGTLTISGTGAMPDFAAPSDAPWYSDVASITTVTVSEGVTAIGANAFVDCADMLHANIPTGVTSIGDNAFGNAQKLKFITFEGDTPPTVTGAAFNGAPSIGTVFVPAGKETDYISALTGRGLDLGARRWEVKEIAYGLYLHTDGLLYMEKDPDPAILDRPAVEGVDYTGTYTANSDGSVLTLENFSFSTNASNVLYLRRDTTIELSGDNTLTGTGVGAGPRNGVRIYGSALTIKNKEGTTGTLTAAGGESSNGDSTGILSNSFTLESGTVTATGAAAPLGSSGVITYGTFTMNGGQLTAKGGVSPGMGFGLYVSKDAIINGTLTAQSEGTGVYAAALYLRGETTGIVTVTGGDDSSQNEELVRNDTGLFVLASDETTLAKYAIINAAPPAYGLYFHSDGVLYLEEDPAAPTLSKPAVQGADYTGSYTGSGSTLTLENFAFSTSAASVLYLPGDTTLELSGGNSLKGTGSTAGNTYGINTKSVSLTIQNKSGTTGTLVVEAGKATGSFSSCGITCGNLTLKSGTVTVQSGNSDTGETLGIACFGNFAVEQGILTAISGTTSGTSAALSFSNAAPTGSLTVLGGATSADRFELERNSATGLYVLKSDGTTLARYAVITPGGATHADPVKNTLTTGSGISGSGTAADPYVATAGSTFTITLAGDRQDAPGSVAGDTQFIPESWSINPSGTFPYGGPYVISTQIDTPGTYTLTAVYRQYEWDGANWQSTSVTDTKTATVRVDAKPNQPGGTPQTADGSGMGLWIALLALSCVTLCGGLLLMRKRRKSAEG